MRIRRRALKAEERDDLVGMLLDKYTDDKKVIEKALPEIAQRLELILPQRSKTRGGSPFGLTELESRRCLKSLQEVVEKLHRKVITPEEAIKGLENSATLLESTIGLTEVSKEDLLKLVKVATGLSPNKKGRSAEKVVRESKVAKSVNVIKGVTLYLTWDTRLVSVQVNPKELKLRDTAVKFVGIGEDKVKDVAEHHDSFLAGGLSSV
jgi:hypothetical protein